MPPDIKGGLFFFGRDLKRHRVLGDWSSGVEGAHILAAYPQLVSRWHSRLASSNRCEGEVKISGFVNSVFGALEKTCR